MYSVWFKKSASLANGHISDDAGKLPLSGNIGFIVIWKILLKRNTDLAVILGGLTLQLQPLNVSMFKPFNTK